MADTHLTHLFTFIFLNPKHSPSDQQTQPRKSSNTRNQTLTQTLKTDNRSTPIKITRNSINHKHPIYLLITLNHWNFTLGIFTKNPPEKLLKMAPNRSSDPLFSPHDRSTRDPRRFGSLGSGSRSSPEFVSPKIGLCSAGRRRKPAVDSPEIELPVGSPFIGSAHGSAGFAPSSDLPHQSVSLSLSRFCLSLSIGFNVS
jgi:hypothetical protein